MPAAPASAGAGPKGVPRTNLPAQLTSFVGRADELDRVGELLAAARLVTLTGPGGAGKTRLAIEAATAARPPRRDGVWFVAAGARTRTRSTCRRPC